MCEDYFSSRCANCAIELQDVSTKSLMMHCQMKSSARTKVTNLQGFSVVYGIPLLQLKQQMINYYAKAIGKIESQFERLPELDELSSVNFALCEKCADIYEIMYSVHKSFSGSANVNSLISTTVRKMCLSQSENNCDTSHVKDEVEDQINVDSPNESLHNYEHPLEFTNLYNDDMELGSSDDSDQELKHDTLGVVSSHVFQCSKCSQVAD